MARLGFTLNTTAEVALTTAGKTVLHLFAPANQRVAVKAFSVSFDGISSTAGAAIVQLCLQSSSGTLTGSTLARTKGGTTEAFNSSGSFNASAEPTLSSVLRTYNINPMTGYERAFDGQEEIELAGGTRVGLFVTPSSAVNCHAFIDGEE
jgi:hypothetical protein